MLEGRTKQGDMNLGILPYYLYANDRSEMINLSTNDSAQTKCEYVVTKLIPQRISIITIQSYNVYVPGDLLDVSLDNSLRGGYSVQLAG